MMNQARIKNEDLDQQKLYNFYINLYSKYKEIVQICKEIVKLEKNAKIEDLSSFFYRYLNDIVKIYNKNFVRIEESDLAKEIVELSSTNEKLALSPIPDDVIDEFDEYAHIVILARALADYIRSKVPNYSNLTFDKLRQKTALIAYGTLNLFNLLYLLLSILKVNVSMYSRHDANTIDEIIRKLAEMSTQIEPFLCNAYLGTEYLGCTELITTIRDKISTLMNEQAYEKARKTYEQKMQEINKYDMQTLHI